MLSYTCMHNELGEYPCIDEDDTHSDLCTQWNVESADQRILRFRRHDDHVWDAHSNFLEICYTYRLLMMLTDITLPDNSYYGSYRG